MHERVCHMKEYEPKLLFEKDHGFQTISFSYNQHQKWLPQKLFLTLYYWYENFMCYIIPVIVLSV